MKRSKKKSEIKKLIFILLIIVIASIITVLLTRYFLIEKVQTFDLAVNVANRVGFNISKGESGILHFGTAPPGSSSSRTLIFDSSDPKPSKVIIKSYGQIKSWIIASENNFILKGNENKTVEIIVVIPENAEFGNYRGKIKLIFKKVFR